MRIHESSGPQNRTYPPKRGIESNEEKIPGKGQKVEGWMLNA